VHPVLGHPRESRFQARLEVSVCLEEREEPNDRYQVDEEEEGEDGVAAREAGIATDHYALRQLVISVAAAHASQRQSKAEASKRRERADTLPKMG